MKLYKMCVACAMIFCVYTSEAARTDNFIHGTMKKGFFSLTTACCIAKVYVHTAMAKFYFKQSLQPNLNDNAKKEYYEVVQPPEHLREWATTPWGVAKEHPSYLWHGSVASIWLLLGLGCVYGICAT